MVYLIFLKRSQVFHILLFSSVSLHWSWGSLSYFLAILWNSAFKWEYLSFSPLPFTSLLFTAIYKASSDNHFIVKGFGVVSRAEVYDFLELYCFFNDPTDVGNLISGSSALSKSSLYIHYFLHNFSCARHVKCNFSCKFKM